jgi:hypothetical protein
MGEERVEMDVIGAFVVVNDMVGVGWETVYMGFLFSPVSYLLSKYILSY